MKKVMVRDIFSAICCRFIIFIFGVDLYLTVSEHHKKLFNFVKTKGMKYMKIGAYLFMALIVLSIAPILLDLLWLFKFIVNYVVKTGEYVYLLDYMALIGVISTAMLPAKQILGVVRNIQFLEEHKKSPFSIGVIWTHVLSERKKLKKLYA